APRDRLVGFGLLGVEERRSPVLCRRSVPAQVTEEQAGMCQQIRLYLQQVARLTKSLPSAPKERLCLPMNPENVGKNLPRGHLAVRLRESHRCLFDLFEQTVARVAASDPGCDLGDILLTRRMGIGPRVVGLRPRRAQGGRRGVTR